MGNLEIYNAVRSVPAEAQKEITAGRLKGKTDINPMWRIKTLTEQFGVAGVGWKTVVKAKWLEKNEATSEVAAFVDIDLYVKIDGQWSEPIEGTGGSMFVSIDKNGLYTDDEAYKKAYTDAISVACKALGVGADVYWDKDTTKYSEKRTEQKEEPKKEEPNRKIAPITNERRVLDAIAIANKKGKPAEMKHIHAWLEKFFNIPKETPLNDVDSNIITELCKALTA